MSQINEPKKLGRLEALLFLYGEALALKKISDVIGVKKDELSALLTYLEESLRDDSRGLQILSEGPVAQLFADEKWENRKVQLVTKPENAGVLEAFVKSELTEELTPAGLEALSLISYFGPISRSHLEYLRGVNSVFTLRNLLLRGLVERFPDPKNANAYLYQPSFALLRHLGVKSKEELPDYQKFQQLLVSFEEQPETEPEPQQQK